MMIGHLSDTHLGACVRTEPEREEDYYNAFREAIEVFIREHVDLVIHSGDILDEPRPYGTAMKVLIQEVVRLKKHDIPFVFTLGEHDISNVPATPHPIILQLQDLGEYIGNGRPRRINGITVMGLYKHKRIERRNLISKLEEISRQLSNLEGKKVLVLHQGIKEAGGLGGELSIFEIPPGFDYYAMGHLHKSYQRNWGHGLLAYPGATHWVSVDDPSECGVFIVDLSGDQPSAEWVRLHNVRPKIKIEVNVNELETKLSELINVDYPMKPCLWIDITTDRQLTVQSIEKRLADKFIVKRVRQILARKEGKVYTQAEEMSLDEELESLAMKVIGNKQIVNFALKELLPRLASGELAEAQEAVWRFFKGGSWRDNKS